MQPSDVISLDLAKKKKNTSEMVGTTTIYNKFKKLTTENTSKLMMQPARYV